jgi:RimJ/RimL family protein N-acetyltransferase
MQTSIQINSQLSLTAFQQADIPNMLLYLNDLEIYQNTLHIPSPYTQADAETWLETTRTNLQKNGVLTNWVIRHENHGLIGGIGAMVKHGLDGHLDEIGYWLAAPFRNQGILTAVVQKLSEQMFETRPLVRIEAHVFSHNPASARVLEKAGYEREGYLRKFHFKNGQYIDAFLYARIRAEG